MLDAIGKVQNYSTDCPQDEGFPVFLCDDIPTEYYSLPIKQVQERGMQAKKALGDQVFILCHHYQRDETFYFHDSLGDSLYLAQQAAKQDAPYIVFCGVHFMAESADILTSPEQYVILPNITAGCSMADMADLDVVEECWEQLEEICGKDRFIPITYINSAASLKAFCGKHGGAVCTSSNTPKIMHWGFEQGKKLLFFPDQHLGRNTANQMGVPRDQINLWNRHRADGGLKPEQLQNTQVLLWSGYCSVHARFNVDQVKAARQRDPEVKVIVHPECSEDVVKAADYAGSTNKILQIIDESPAGTHWVVGTEINMVHRLHKQYFKSQGKRVECLNANVCPCSTMYRTHPANVLWVLENLVQGRVVNQIKVPDQTAHWARIALNRMLELS